MSLSSLVVFHVPWILHMASLLATQCVQCQHYLYPACLRARLDSDHCLAAKELELLDLCNLSLHPKFATY